MLCNLRHLLVSEEHFYYNTVCKVCNRKDQDCFLITDLPCFHIHNLSAYNNFTHLTGNRFQGNRLSFEISSINNIRIAVPAEATAEISFFVFPLSKRRFFLLFCRCLVFFFVFVFRFRRLCLFCRLLSVLFFAAVQFCMADNILYLLCNLGSCIFSVSALLCLHKIQLHFQIHAASLTKNLVEIFHQNFTFLPGDYRIRKYHTQIILSRKSNLCLFEHIVLKHVIAAQFQFHTGTISFQKVLRGILSGQPEFFNNSHSQFKS